MNKNFIAWIVYTIALVGAFVAYHNFLYTVSQRPTWAPTPIEALKITAAQVIAAGLFALGVFLQKQKGGK